MSWQKYSAIRIAYLKDWGWEEGATIGIEPKRGGRNPRSDSKCQKVLWKRIKGTGSKDYELSVNRMIKDSPYGAGKIAEQVEVKGKSFCL